MTHRSQPRWLTSRDSGSGHCPGREMRAAALSLKWEETRRLAGCRDLRGKSMSGRKPRRGQGGNGRGWRQTGMGVGGGRTKSGGRGCLQLRPSAPKASRSPEGPVALGLSLPAEMQQTGNTCRVAPVRKPQVSLAEACLPPSQAGLLVLPHPPPRPKSLLGQDQWSGSGAQEASDFSLGLLSHLGGGGGVAAGLPSSGAYMSWAWDSDRSLLA